jgi:GntR family transcriptional regulator
VNLFAIDLKAGAPLYEQVLYAARKAILSGELKPGNPFPSVREIAGHLRINPNTVQKALTALKTEGLVETVPGIGNRVCERPEPRPTERAALLNEELEALVMRARQLRLSLPDLTEALHDHWNRFTH